jgi:hypothetical protein
MRKIVYLFLLMLLCTHPGKAQLLKPGSVSAEFSDNLNKIVLAFRTNFHQIQGDALPPEAETDVYRSNVSLPGSIQTFIYRFHSVIDTTASWQALMFQGDNYTDALKAYKNTSRLLNKSRLMFPGKSPVGFSGKLNEPDVNVAFANSSFKLDIDDPAYVRFYAEIEMVNTGFDSWEVHLNLHNKKADTEKY